MAKNHKRLMTIMVCHVRTTDVKAQEVGQAIMNVLNHHLSGETDGVTIGFVDESKPKPKPTDQEDW